MKFSLASVERGVISVAGWGFLLGTPAIGLLLADVPDLRIYKVLNLIGIVWSILGVITLSYLSSASEAFQISSLRVSTYIFSALVWFVPMGISIGGLAALILTGFPSAKASIVTGLYLMFPGGISFIFIQDFVSQPRLKFVSTTKKRITFLGGYFIFAGLVAQLVGAAFDLVNFNG